MQRALASLGRFATSRSGDAHGVSMMQSGSAAGYLTRAPRSSGLADVLEILLDRGLVIDAYVRVSLVGIELLTVDLRVVIASVDTYLRFAEAVNRLDLRAVDDSMSVADLAGGEAEEEMAESAGKGAVEGGMDAIKEKIGLGGRRKTSDDDEEE
jgi:gas vesicle structural protein